MTQIGHILFKQLQAVNFTILSVHVYKSIPHKLFLWSGYKTANKKAANLQNSETQNSENKTANTIQRKQNSKFTKQRSYDSDPCNVQCLINHDIYRSIQ